MFSINKIRRQLCLASVLPFFCVQLWAQPVGLPSMGAASSMELSPAVERTLGQAIMQQGYQDPTYIADLDINQYLTDIGRRLAAHAPQPLSQEINIFAVRDPAINAFALPGGYIGINSGLVVATESESQLASVIAHEISHVMQRHIARGLSQQSQSTGIMVASLVGALLAALAGQGDLAMGVASFGQAAAIDKQLGFSRSAEQEADRAGLQMMSRAGFDPYGMYAMFQRLMNAARLNEGAGRGYATTHPLSIQRLSDIENRLDKLKKWSGDSNPEYWFVRMRLELIQARDNASRLRIEQSLRSQLKHEQALQRAVAYFGLALLARQVDKFEQARKLLELARDEQNSPEIDILAIELGRIRADGSALELSQRAWQQWPTNQGVAYQRALSLQQAKQNQAAVDFLQARIQQWPQVQAFYKVLANSENSLGHTLQANEAMATYYELQGALPTAVEHLEQARSSSNDFYAQSRIDVRIRELRQRLENQRALLEPFKG